MVDWGVRDMGCWDGRMGCDVIEWIDPFLVVER